ncbi:hypothetical protein MBLNU459_g4444t2 [Dothideomycetes sp. NU459]
MAKFTYLFWVLTFCCAHVLADQDPSSDQYCVYSVYLPFSYFIWSDGTSPSSAGQAYDVNAVVTTQCTVMSEIMSIYASSKLYCTPSEITSGFKFLGETCEEAGVEMISLDNIIATATESYIRNLTIVDPSQLPPFSSFTQPVVLSRQYFKLSLRTVRDAYGSMTTNYHYGYGLHGFWAGILLLGMANRLCNFILNRRVATSRKRASTSSVLGRVEHWYSAYVKVPAAFGSYHQRLFYWCTIPTRLETLVVLSWWIINIVLSCTGIDAFDGYIFGSSVSQQVWRYVADRTGILAFATLPWVWMFAGRNNIFIWATGWNFGTFNVFHRHVARAATVHAIVHSIAFAVDYSFYPGEWTQDVKTHWMQFGIVAAVTMFLLVILGSTWLRRKWYEAFLVGHISMSILLIVALFVHTSLFGTLYNPFLWPLVAIWSFDRFLRFVRLAYCNLHVRSSVSSMTSPSTTITYKKETDVLRIEVQLGSELLKPGPGQHYYLYQPMSFRCWENHPFTLGAYSVPLQLETPKAENDSTKKDIEVNITSAEPNFYNDNRSSTEKNLIFWVRPYDGWTKRLRNQCLKSTSGVIQPKLLLEGPYGHAASLPAYDTVLMFTGGTGVAAAVPYILDHIQRSGSAGKTRTTTMHLHWSARQHAFFKDVSQRELAHALERPDFHASFYCTDGAAGAGPSSKTSASASTSGEISPVENKLGSQSASSSCRGIEIQRGRPDVTAVILGAAQEAAASSSRLAVLVCGPAAMADEARAAVSTALRQGVSSIAYFEEAYGW